MLTKQKTKEKTQQKLRPTSQQPAGQGWSGLSKHADLSGASERFSEAERRNESGGLVLVCSAMAA